MKYGIIVAANEMGLIGVPRQSDNPGQSEGVLPWHLPADLKRFKAVTDGHIVIMGRKTHESIVPALKNRFQIVITGNEDLLSREPTDELVYVDSYYAAKTTAYERYYNHIFGVKDKNNGGRMYPDHIWVIGGSSIYHDALYDSETNLVLLTRIQDNHGEVEDGTYFPIDVLDYNTEWRMKRSAQFVNHQTLKGQFEVWERVQ